MKASKLIAIIIITIILTGCAAEVEPSGDPIAAIVSGHRLAIESQPEGNKVYVTDVPDTLTLFDAEALVLLAHDYLAGQYIAGLVVGDEVVVKLETGQVVYTVTAIEHYQQQGSSSAWSVPGDDEAISSTSLAQRVYGVSGRLVLQTCFDGTGRMFVIAERN